MEKTYLVTLTVDIPFELVADTAEEAREAALAKLKTDDAFNGSVVKAINTKWIFKPQRRRTVRRSRSSPD
jgi:hypothetical protein